MATAEQMNAPAEEITLPSYVNGIDWSQNLDDCIVYFNSTTSSTPCQWGSRCNKLHTCWFQHTVGDIKNTELYAEIKRIHDSYVPTTEDELLTEDDDELKEVLDAIDYVSFETFVAKEFGDVQDPNVLAIILKLFEGEKLNNDEEDVLEQYLIA